MVVLATQSPDIIGLFHDDGLYAASARALVHDGVYSIPSLPGEPLQTKYPPVYSLLLAPVWLLLPTFPDNVAALKSVNAALVGLLLFGVGRLTQAMAPRAPLMTSAAAILVLGTTPGVVTFADYTMSDILFLSIVVWFLVVSARIAESPSTTRHLVLASLIVIAILSRSIGICLVISAVLDQLLRGHRRWALRHAVVGGVTFGAWSLWASIAAGAPGRIVSYYLEYETSAVGYLRSDPGLAVSLVLGNLSLAVDGARLVLGPSFWFWPLLLILAVAGGIQIWRGGHRVPFLFGAVYVAVVLAHPFAPHRYLLPLLPVLYLAVFEGARVSLDRLVPVTRRTSPALTSLVTMGIAGLMLFGNVAWVQLVRSPAPEGHLRGWYGFNLGYDWAGFEETFAWIRENTDPRDRLGSIFDPMYHLYTGRQSVRPWFHRPETYFYPPNAPRPFVGRPADVAAELRALGVSYLVLDPPAGYAEGEAATAMLRELLALDEVDATPVFISSDGKHEIHHLRWRSVDGDS